MKNHHTVFIFSTLLLNTVSHSDFTIGVVPDVQYLSESANGGDMMKNMNQFFVDRKEELNVVFVASLGDMTNNLTVDLEWERSFISYHIFEDAGIPFTPTQGNHDDIDYMNKWFPLSLFEDKPWFGGTKEGGMEHSYFLFEADNMKFVMTVTPMQNVDYAWSREIMDTYSDRRGIVINHDFGKGDNKESSLVEKSDNVFMAAFGHRCENDGSEYWTTQSLGGTTQHMLRANYQCWEHNGSQFRYYTFKPNQDSVCAFTYNMFEERYERESRHQFCFEYAMPDAGDGLPHTLTVNPASGGSVTLSDPGDRGSYPFGTPVQITAVPREGYRFMNWTGAITGAHNPAVVTLDSNKTVSPVFGHCSVVQCTERTRFSLSSWGEERLSDGRVFTDNSLIGIPRSEEGDESLVGLNFSGVTLPAGTEITHAYIQFVNQEQELNSTDVPSIDIWAESRDNSEAFLPQDDNISTRSRTTAALNWKPHRWKRKFRRGPSQQTPPLNVLLNEVLARPGWNAGNSLSILFQRAGDTDYEKYSAGATRLAQTNGEQGPVLVVDYVIRADPLAMVMTPETVRKPRAQLVSDRLDISYMGIVTSVEIYDMRGKKRFYYIPTKYQQSIGLQGLQQGWYLMRAKANGRFIQQPVVKLD